MLASTGTVLVFNFLTFYRAYAKTGVVAQITNMSIAAVLFLLGIFVVFEAVRVWVAARGMTNDEARMSNQARMT
ncbi:MAG: hypothetical protein QM702_03615 [Rubrivivax sp.]